MSTESNKIASNTLSQIIGRIFVLALTLISIKLITNYLGTTGTGYYSAIITYFSLFIVIADFGLFSVAVREASKRPEEQTKIFKNILYIRMASSIIATLIALVLVYFTHYSAEVKHGVLAAALFPIFNLTGSVYDMLFQIKLEMQKVAASEVVSKVIVVVAVYLVVLTDAGFYGIVATVSLAAVTSFLAKAIMARKELPFNPVYNRAIAKEIVLMAAPLGVVFIVNNLYFKVDTLILLYFKGGSDVGIYAVAYRVLETTLFAGSYLSSSLKPLLSKSIGEDQTKASKALSQANVFLLFMALIIAIICLSFPKEIILFLSNSDYLPGWQAMMILGLAGIFIYLSGMMGEVMIAKDLRKKMIAISTFILCFNIALNLYLIPRYSYNGAALATLISEIILFSISYSISKRVVTLSFDLVRIFKLIFISALTAILAFGLKSLGLFFIPNILLIIIFYLTTCYFFDAVPKAVVANYLTSISNKWPKKSSL